MSKAKNKFDIDVDAVSHDELKHAYRRLLASRNGLKSQNADLSKWASDISQAISKLACEGALAFQLMAEKANVRGHPSVSEAVKLFDSISHPQWHHGRQTYPEVSWPTDWNFDEDRAQSGDADMSLNAHIALAIEALEHMKYGKPNFQALEDAKGALQSALRLKVEGVKAANGFVPKKVTVPSAEHYREMSREELIELVGSLTWMALDLAQDMDFANYMLRRDLRASAYRRIGADLYALSNLAFGGDGVPKFDIQVFGAEEPA